MQTVKVIIMHLIEEYVPVLSNHWKSYAKIYSYFWDTTVFHVETVL